MDSVQPQPIEKWCFSDRTVRILKIKLYLSPVNTDLKFPSYRITSYRLERKVLPDVVKKSKRDPREPLLSQINQPTSPNSKIKTKCDKRVINDLTPLSNYTTFSKIIVIVGCSLLTVNILWDSCFVFF